MMSCSSYAMQTLRPATWLGLSVVSLIIVLAMGVPDIAFSEDAPVESAARSSRGDERGPLERWRDATPSERRAVRDAGRERWERATPRERRIFRRGMVGLRHAVPEFSEIERLVLLRNLFALPKKELRAMRKRLRRIDDLEADERARLIEELRAIADRPSADSRRIERNVGRWRDMSESDREKYREQMRRFQALSIAERRKLFDEWEDPERSTKGVEGPPDDR